VRGKLQRESSFFALDLCSPLPRGQVYTCESRCRGDIIDFRFTQQELINDLLVVVRTFRYVEKGINFLYEIFCGVGDCGALAEKAERSMSGSGINIIY